MSSVCISNCVNDARDPRVPVRATYVNLYKWPESDAEFVRSVTRSRGTTSTAHRHVHGQQHHHHHHHPRVVDSISCRQMYLRSYTFSREEDYVKDETTSMCFGRSSSNKETERVDRHHRRQQQQRRRKRKLGLRKLSCAALYRIFHRLLSCTASVDVVHGT